MKICEYCGIEVEDDVNQCSGCGSSTFKNEGIDSEASLLHEENSSVNVIESYVSVQIGTQTLLETKRKPRVAPIIFGIFCVFVFIVIVAASVKTSVENSGTTDNAKTAVKTEVKKELSDIELVTLEGHPRFYGNFKEAEEFWKGYKKVKVVNAAQSSSNGDALLLITTGNDDWDNDFITSIYLNFHNTESKNELTVDDLLKIVCGYIPYEILEKYYKFDYAFHETSYDGDYESYHYIAVLNDAGKAANESEGKNYDDKFAFAIEHEKDNGWNAFIKFTAYEGNFQRFGLKYYKVYDWVADINKYK